MKFKALGELSKPRQWKSLASKEFTNDGYPVYGANGVIGHYTQYNHEHETIAIGCRGACGFVHITTPKSYITSNAMSLDDLDVNECNLHYLANYLKYRGFSDVTTGAAQPQITRTNLDRVQIPLPSLHDQIRIAHLLGKVEGLIAQRKQHLQQLDDLLKSVFLEMFGDPVRNGMKWDELAVKEFSDSRLGKMRDKKFISGNHLRKYLGNSNVQWFRFVVGDLLEMDFDERERAVFSLQYGDLLVCEGGDIGRCAIWKNQVEDCYFQKALHRVRVDPKLAVPEYIQFVFLFFSIFNGFKITSKATIAHLTGEKLAATKVPLPPIGLQSEFAGIVEKVEAIKSRYQQSLTDLEALYGALSQKAFKGELDLSRVPMPGNAH